VIFDLGRKSDASPIQLYHKKRKKKKRGGCVAQLSCGPREDPWLAAREKSREKKDGRRCFAAKREKKRRSARSAKKELDGPRRSKKVLERSLPQKKRLSAPRNLSQRQRGAID